jgi:amidase
MTADEVEFLALPTLRTFPPTIDDATAILAAILTLPVNLAGVPALAHPVPTPGGRGAIPASLQLVGPARGEEMLLAAGRLVEAATR